MKIKLNRSAIQAAIKRVAGAVPNTSPIEIMTHLLVTVSDGRAKWTGGRVDAQLTVTTDVVESDGEGKFTLPARKFNALLAGLQGVSEITMEVDEQTTVLRAGRSRYTLHGLDASLFPVLAMEAKTVLVLNSQSLAAMLMYVQPCVSNGKDMRPYTQGISVRAGSGNLEIMAIEATRLAYSSEAIKDDSGEVMIHRDSVPLVLGVLQDADSAWMGIGESKYKIIVGDYELVASRLDASLPDVTRLVGETRDYVYVDMAEIKSAVARMMIFAEDNNRCTITMSPTEIRLRSGASDQADEVLSIRDGNGFDAEAHVSIVQVKEALDVSRGEQIGVGLPRVVNGNVFLRESEDAKRHTLMTQLRV